MISVLIADDETLMRAGIRLILDNAEDVDVVAEVADGPAAVHACRSRQVDVALLDIRMPGGDGIDAVTDIARTSPATRTVMLTAFGEDHNVAKALREGARGFLLKDTGPAELIRAVRHVAAGESILAPRITQRLVERHLATPDGTEHARDRISALANSETEVLELVGAGLSNGEIAQRLHMGTGTVKAHVSRILTKLDCANRVQAAILAHDSGLLSDKP